MIEIVLIRNGEGRLVLKDPPERDSVKLYRSISPGAGGVPRVVELSSAEQRVREVGDKEWEDSALDRARAELRKKRDALLRDSDWTQLDDVALSDAEKKLWAEYRQTLRDLVADIDDTLNPTWPKMPTKEAM